MPIASILRSASIHSPIGGGGARSDGGGGTRRLAHGSTVTYIGYSNIRGALVRNSPHVFRVVQNFSEYKKDLVSVPHRWRVASAGCKDRKSSIHLMTMLNFFFKLQFLKKRPKIIEVVAGKDIMFALALSRPLLVSTE